MTYVESKNPAKCRVWGVVYGGLYSSGLNILTFFLPETLVASI